MTVDTLIEFVKNDWKWLLGFSIPLIALFIQWRSHKAQFEEQLYIERYINHITDDWYSYRIKVRNNSEHQWDVQKIRIKSNPNCRFLAKQDCFEPTEWGDYAFSKTLASKAEPLIGYIKINETIPPISQSSHSVEGSWNITGLNEFSFEFVFTPASHRKSEIKLSSKAILASSKSLRFRKTITIEKIMIEHIK